jgi:hypothetical protein
MKLPTEQEAAARNLELARIRVDTCREDFRRASVALSAAKRALVTAELESAKLNPHPWAGMEVYRLMGGKDVRHRMETGKVSLMEQPDPNASHISVGMWYVRLDNGSAAWLDGNWKPELF